ncbi:Golgi apparatus membrane protein tvp23 [Pelomyxa schiedti]|nr:Golgi apparatus membrane protein tvp23 [Pelomyxa schiedti]
MIAHPTALMVGLRWWNEVKADGTSEWRFESQDPGLRNTNHIEMLAFWSCIILTPLLWLGFGILALIKINWDWLVLVCIAFVLTGANVVGYVKCAKDQRTGIKKAALSYATQQIITQGVNQMTQQV